MSLSLQQTCRGKTRAEFAEETQHERQVMAELTARLVAAELAKTQQPIDSMTAERKALIIAHAVRMAFAIARAVTTEDIRRNGKRIDMV